MSVHVFIFDSENEPHVHESLDALQNTPQSSTVWVDLETDDEQQLFKVAEHFGFHELTVEDCLTPQHFPKIDDYGAYLFFIFRALKPWSEVEEIWERERVFESPVPIDDESDESLTRKIALFLGQNFVVTHRREEVPWLDALVRHAQQSPEQTLQGGTSAIAHRVIDVLTDRFMRGMGFFERKIDDFEEVVFKDPDSLEVADILEMKREISSLRQIMRTQRAVLAKLANDPNLIPEKHTRRYYKDIDDHARMILRQTDQQIESLLSIRDSYLTMSNVRLGDTMRILTVITTVAAPLNIVVGLYGMNFKVIPLLHNPHGFWFVVSVMFAVVVLMLAYFRGKRWI